MAERAERARGFDEAEENRKREINDKLQDAIRKQPYPYNSSNSSSNSSNSSSSNSSNNSSSNSSSSSFKYM
ncbi:hypothetical protein Emag_006325 [Eimeria magna]